jgi:hypothetical protein
MKGSFSFTRAGSDNKLRGKEQFPLRYPVSETCSDGLKTTLLNKITL